MIAISVHGGLDWSDLADRCSRIPFDAAVEWLEDYHERTDVVRLLTDAVPVTVGGLQGLEQTREFRNRISRAVFLFSHEHVLVVYCQWTEPEFDPIINDGCEQIFDSMHVP